MTVLRYIHQNPVKAGLVGQCADWRWSSYSAYERGQESVPGLTDVAFALAVHGERSRMLQFTNQPNTDSCLEFDALVRLSATQLEAEAIRMLGGAPLEQLRDLPTAERDKILCYLKSFDGASIRQIAQITGLGRGTVQRA